MAPQHPLAEELIKDHPEHERIFERVKQLRAQGTSDLEILNREKEGVFSGRYAINPVNGERVPIWIANFVVMNYGTGIVMAVPAHDQRDFEFARKYGMQIRVVIQPPSNSLNCDTMTYAYVHDGTMVHSGDFSRRKNTEAMPDLLNWLEKKGFGKKTVTYRLRDWLLSRQRYWGAPIPVVYCDRCGIVGVPEDQLPVRLPKNVEFRPFGESPLAVCEEFMNAACPACGGKARRESDTMDTFVDSSWYFLRYTSPRAQNAAFLKEDVKYWCPVDIYIGGIEHATMHLIYVRFFTMVLKDLGLIDFEEPATKLFCQGMVCKTAFYCEKDKWLKIEQARDGKCTICGGPVRSEIAKMSKTKLNTVSPEEIIEKYGADTMRMYILADNPPDRDQVWSDEGVLGISRFLNRFWDTISEMLPKLPPARTKVQAAGGSDKKIRLAAHNTLQKCRLTYEENWQFNTCIARIMELLNVLRKEMQTASGSVLRESLEILAKLIAPITPHIAEELWQKLGYAESIFLSPVPKVDESALVQDTITMAVQINGKLRGTFEINAEAGNEEMEKAALTLENTQKHIAQKTVKKVIVVPGKLVNIVVA
jgi:leucyl-tRNA synthetase